MTPRITDNGILTNAQAVLTRRQLLKVASLSMSGKQLRKASQALNSKMDHLEIMNTKKDERWNFKRQLASWSPPWII